MTKKDYIILADTIVKTIDDVFNRLESKNNRQEQLVGLAIFTDNLGKALLNDNPKFDPERFSGYINEKNKQNKPV